MEGRRKRDVRASDFESKSKNMDGLDSDMILEIPDTPDRLAARRPVDGSSKPYWERDIFRSNANPKEPYIPRARRSSFCDLSGSSTKSDDTEFLFREANLARQLPNPSESDKSRETIELDSRNPFNVSHHTRCQEPWRSTGRSLGKDKVEDLYGDGLNSIDKGKAIHLGNNPKPINCTYSVQNTNNSSNGNGIDLLRGSEFASRQPTRPRVASQRRLVRNGCISPLNINRCRNDGKQKEVEVGNDRTNSHHVHIISPDSESKLAGKMKAKVAVEDIVVDDEKSFRGQSQTSRFRSSPGKEVTVISDVEGGDNGWRTTSNHMRKSSTSSSLKTGINLKRKDASGDPSNGSQEGAVRNGISVNVIDPDAASLEHETDLQMEGRRGRGKRKLDPSNCHVGESSSSISIEVGSSNLRSSTQPSNLRSTRTRRCLHSGLIPIIEVEESPEAVSNMCSISDYSIAQERQVESDELLARQLQEEFYNETPRIEDTDEIDAAVALLLQDGEGQHASVSRQHQSRRRDSSSSSSRPRFRQTANRGRLPTSSRMAQLRRNFTMMNLNMRLDLLGPLAFNRGGNSARVRPSNIHHIQRDFNENDYEMLLALDENNNQHGGASESQINNLPQSIIQNADSQEACAVCLDTPTVGDTIRHLPCLHKFHKECIDTWLRRKRLCPICKSNVQ